MNRPANGFWAGLVVGILLVTLLMSFHVDINGDKSATTVTPVLTSNADAQSFVNAWKKMSNGTWAATYSYMRTVGGKTVTQQSFSAQKAPNYLTESAGTVTAAINGASYVCASAADGKLKSCKTNGTAVTFDAYAAAKVAQVQNVVVGASSSYGVQALETDCFAVYLAPGKTANNWGTHSQFCFDAATGALISSERYTDSGTELTSVTNLRAPTDADFKIS